MNTNADDSLPGARRDQSAHDTDAGLQDELRREAAERAALGGDTATNRSLSGSTTWVTLGDAADTPPADQPDAPDGRGRTGAP